MSKILKTLIALLFCTLAFTSVFALNINDTQKPFESNGTGIESVDTAVKNVWSTVLTVVQILAVAAVVFAGLRYMFASADQKADIKKSMGILAVGAVLVFASTTVLQFVVRATKEAIPTK